MPDGESSVTVREKVARARQIQVTRQGKLNARLNNKEIDLFCQPDAAGSTLLKQAMTRLNLSARAYHRVLKVARSIADLDNNAPSIATRHVAEAIQYRRFAKD